MNPLFVNAKIDMEKGEGPELAKRFDVRVYPTYLFLNSEGQLIHRMVGSQGSERFIAAAKKGLSGEGYGALKARYDKGDRDVKFMQNYLRVLGTELYMTEEASQVAENYLKDKAGQLLTDSVLFHIFSTYIQNPTTDVFQYVYARQKDFCKKYGDGIEYTLNEVWHKYPQTLYSRDGKVDEAAKQKFFATMQKNECSRCARHPDIDVNS